MKTKNLKTRKLKNGLLKTGAAVASFVLISLTVSAQGFWKQLLSEGSLSKVATMMAGDARKGTNAGWSVQMEKYQDTLAQNDPNQIQMNIQTTTGNAAGRLNNCSAESASSGKDQDLTIEDWMLNDRCWEL